MLDRRHWLLRIPAAFYGMAVGVRNFAFDKGWLHSEKSNIPTICVGNLAVGGTGKTPHIEMLIRMLKAEYRVAVLTRGYGRATKEPIVASPDDDAYTIGDEPFQIKRKFPDVMIYIDGDRRRALKAMEALPPEERPDVVLMDDGFQHRYVTPAYSILLTSFHNTYTDDYFLPFGSLRDGAKEAVRADTIIITNTPDEVTPVELRLKRESLGLLAFQDQYFSRVRYEAPRCLFAETAGVLIPLTSKVLVVSGIANPKAFEMQCQKHFDKIEDIINYPDHHRFSEEEVNQLIERLRSDRDLNMVTTEKDAMRLLGFEELFTKDIRGRIWYLPIQVELSLDSRIRILRKAKQAIKNNGLTI